MDDRSLKRLCLPRRKNQLRGIWALAEMFDFRTGRTNQKLISNGKTAIHKHNSDAEHLRKVDKQTNFCEKCSRDIEDKCKIKVTDIVQEEFPTEKPLKQLLRDIKEQRTKSDFGCVHHSATNPKAARKTPQKASQMPYECSRRDESSLDSHNFTAMLEEICSQLHQEGKCNGDIPRSVIPSRFKQLDEINSQLLQMSAKAFIDQMYINRRYTSGAAAIHKSTPFSDASEMLRLNRDLFLKLLQDPNPLLGKHIQKLQFPKRERDRRKLLWDSKSSECQSSGISKYGDPECVMRMQKKNTNTHLWKKLKDRYGFSFKGSRCSGSNQIVVLEPASKSRKHLGNVSCHCSGIESHQIFNNKGQNIKSKYFSMKDIRKKLKQAVGENRKEQHYNRISGKRHSLKYADMRISHSASTRESTLSNHFNRMEKQRKPRWLVTLNGPEIESNDDNAGKKLNSQTPSFSKEDQFDIFTEAKRRLSERFKSVNVGEKPPQNKALRTLEMVLSSPDSPKRDMNASVPEPMRLSIYSIKEKGKVVGCQSFQKQNEEIRPSTDLRSDDQLITSESKPNLLEDIHAGTEVHEIICSRGDIKHSGHASILEENRIVLPVTSNKLEAPNEKVDSTNSGQSIETSEASEDNGDEEFSSLDDLSEDHHQISSAEPASTPLGIPGLQILVSGKDREGHPSPVSVLEPFSSEDTNSPTILEPAGSPLQPRHIDFDAQFHVEPTEDPKINVTAFMEGDDYISEYVRAVMQASELNFEELSVTSTSLTNALDSYLFNSVGLFQVGTNSDLNLLLDCIHEILVGVYHSYSGYSPCKSFLKPSISSVPPEANVVEQVVREVNYYLLFPQERQHTLDQLASRDVTKSGSWLELRPDTKDIAIQIAEDVLQDSVVDTILELQI